jgi:diguanylate cyclase (GGDEF)-like protein
MRIHTSTQEMVKDLKEVKGVFANQDKPARKQYNRELEQQARLDLALTLQMSLDVDWVLNKFMEHIHAYFLFDGFAYQCAQPAVQIESARQKGHSCTYQLHIEEMDMGKLEIYRGRKFVESELVLLENLLSILVYPLRNALQYKNANQLAYCDALTGIRNRSTFVESFERELHLAQRHRQDITLLVIDIDHFKQVNDQHGHAVGDEVLIEVANRIQASIRTTDMLFRYGGEEFVAVLTNSDCEASHDIAERILHSVREIEMQTAARTLGVTVSIGLACRDAQDDRHSLFDRADKAMYAAKHAGRNQIQVFTRQS